MYLPISAIQPHPDNPPDRSIPDPLLAEDIKRRGILDLLLVSEDGPPHPLYDGHRRLAAAALAGLTEVPVRMIKAASAEEIRLVTVLHRKDLSCPAKVKTYLALKKLHAKETTKQLCERISVDSSLGTVYESYETCDPKVQKAFDEGRITLSSMYWLSRRKDQLEILPMFLSGMPHKQVVSLKRLNDSRKERTKVARIKLVLGKVTVVFSGKGISRDDALQAAHRAVEALMTGKDAAEFGKTISKVPADQAKAAG